MAYHALPKFDPSAQYLFTPRVPVFNGVPRTAGEVFPLAPEDPGAARRHLLRLEQMYYKRLVTMVEPSANSQAKHRKDKPHGRAKG